MNKFILIGDGMVAKYHRQAIQAVNGHLVAVCDPKYEEMGAGSAGWPEGEERVFTNAEYMIGKLLNEQKDRRWVANYIVIASPSNLHAQHIWASTAYCDKVIVEKPLKLPWEPPIQSPSVRVVLQLRYLELPKYPARIDVVFVRDDEYFDSWKGDPMLTGGVFYNLFIHYIDFAIRHNIPFTGKVVKEGSQNALITYEDGDYTDIRIDIDMDRLYLRMYEDIMRGGGATVEDTNFLHWVLDRNGLDYGIGANTINKLVSYTGL